MSVQNFPVAPKSGGSDDRTVLDGHRALLLHDIKGALQGVTGGASMLEQADLDPRAREQAERIAEAVRALSSLLDDWLGEGEGGDETVDLARFIQYVRRRWTGEAKAAGLGLRIRVAEDAPERIDMPSGSLARIIGNLIQNALKYAGTGSVALHVSAEPSGALAFSVRDDGPGFDDTVLARFRNRSGAPVGTAPHGLGLRIVRALAEEAGAIVSIANRAEGGAVATLRLPPTLVGERAAVQRPAATLAGLTILLAEDNPTNQLVATQMLQALEADVVVANDGVEALECFEAAPFDLVVVDIEMPRLSGLDVIRTIRARADARSATPIVALTAYAMREHRERIAEAGANGLVSKPITSVEELGRALSEHMARAGPPGPRPVPAPLAEPDPEAEIDQEVFGALCKAIGPETMAELLDKVVADLTRGRSDLAAALDPVDRARIRATTHILVSVAGAIGAVRLQNRAQALNRNAHQEAEPRIVEVAQSCLAELKAAIAFAAARRAEF